MAEDQTPDEAGNTFYEGLFRDPESPNQSAPLPRRRHHQELNDDTLFRRSRRHAAPPPQTSTDELTDTSYRPRRTDDPVPTPTRPQRMADPVPDEHTAWPPPSRMHPHSSAEQDEQDEQEHQPAAAPIQVTAPPPAAASGVPTPVAAALQAPAQPTAEPSVQPGTPQRAAHVDPEDAAQAQHRHRFTRSLGLTALSTLIPGAGLIGSKLRWVGVTLVTLLVVGGGLSLWWLRSHADSAVAMAGSPATLTKISVGLLLLAAVWVVLIVGTHVLTRPRKLTSVQRAVGVVAVGLLSFAVAAPMAMASQYASVTAGVISNVAKKGSDTKSETRPTLDTTKAPKDVWAGKPRVNVLLVGSDQSTKRAQLGNKAEDINTDTMMVASIDTKTGDTVLIQIPRNMARVPFATDTKLGKELAARYPQGWFTGDSSQSDSWANSIWAHVPAFNPELFKNTSYPGADALKIGLQGALGLKIDYFVSLDIDGLVNLINAMGGVRLNVNKRIPIGGDSEGRPPVGWIEPGPNQLLNGFNAMWYARSRSDSDDFTRMGRQSCVIKAVIDQADPTTLVTRFEAITKAGGDMLDTDIPQEAIPAFLELAMRVKDGTQSRILFVHGEDGYDTTNPDYAMIHKKVAAAIAAAGTVTKGAPATTAPASSASKTPAAPKTSSTTQPGSTPSSSSPAQSLTDACAYNPVP